MAIGVDFRTLVDARSVGAEVIVSDFYDIPSPPAAGFVTYRTIELPLNVITAPSITDQFVVREVHPITHAPLGPVFSKAVYPTTPLSGEYQIRTPDTFSFGYLVFNKLDGGKTVEIIYTGRGSLVFAADVNDPRDEVKDSRDTETDLGTRLDAIEDGTRIQSYKILPRHISNVATDDYTFPRHIFISGDLNVTGVINREISEILTSSDEILVLNSDFAGAPTNDCGLTIERGSSADASLFWRETPDRWELTTGGLYLPDGDLELNGNEIKRASFELVADGVAEAALVGSAFDGQLIYRTDVKAPRYYDSTAGAFKSLAVAVLREDYVIGTIEGSYTGSTTVIDLTMTYNVGSNQLLVYASGLLQTKGAGEDYQETDNNTITFNSPQLVGRNISIVNMSAPV